MARWEWTIQHSKGETYHTDNMCVLKNWFSVCCFIPEVWRLLCKLSASFPILVQTFMESGKYSLEFVVQSHNHFVCFCFKETVTKLSFWKLFCYFNGFWGKGGYKMHHIWAEASLYSRRYCIYSLGWLNGRKPTLALNYVDWLFCKCKPFGFWPEHDRRLLTTHSQSPCPPLHMVPAGAEEKGCILRIHHISTGWFGACSLLTLFLCN